MWKCLQNLSLLEINSIISSDSKLGSIDESLNRTSKSILSSSYKRSIKVSFFLNFKNFLPKSPKFIPVRTTSLMFFSKIELTLFKTD